MDLVSITAAVGGMLLSCDRISTFLVNVVDDVKNIDVTVASFRTEVSSLEEILITIDSSLKGYPTTAADTNAPLWSSM
jgi:hypothetical protein